MVKKIVGTLAIGVCGISLYYGVAFSTPSSGQTNTSVLTGTFDELNVKHSGEARVTVRTREDVDIVTTQATLAAGGYTSASHASITRGKALWKNIRGLSTSFAMKGLRRRNGPRPLSFQ